MKETIEYYYNLDIDAFEEKDGKYYFKINNEDYFFVFWMRSVEELRDIIDICKQMNTKGINPHQILININNSYLTKVNEGNYILFKNVNLKETYDIFDMINYNDKLILNSHSLNLYRNNWDVLWSKKMDYFESQVHDLALSKNIIKDSFSYYEGMCEMAIAYVKATKDKYLNEGRITLAHKRVFYPNYKLNYMNPLSFIFDLEIRDIAEYIKSMFFKNDAQALLELSTYLKVRRLTMYEYQMLLARLIYPTYYFDVYDSTMNNNVDEEILLDIIDKVDDYELFLKKAYLEIKKYANIEKIDFLEK